ncbi:MAG: hypothetical protein F6K35_41430, partial [Okeania sp. SIO2H7]|nr:hypothetical protein [Okeania sp. SIO2H7]
HGKTITDTPLNHAITHESPEIVKLLLEAGAGLENFVWVNLSELLQKSNYKFSDSSREILSLIIDAGIDLNSTLENGKTLLMHTAAAGAIDTVKFLVENGADANVIRRGECALESAARLGRKEVYEYLAPLTSPELRAKAEKELPEGLTYRERKDSQLLNAFMDAVGSGNIELLQNILADGMNVDAFNTDGNTALCIAAIAGDASVARLIIEAGADVNLGNETDGQTPLIYAAGFVAQAQHFSEDNEAKYIKSIQILINAGANVNLSDRDGYRPLTIAASSKSIKAVKQLIQAGADVNAKTNDGWTALSAAASVGSIEVVKLLLQAGASLNVRDDYGKNALSYAREEEHSEIIQFLLEAGAQEE